MNEESGVEPQRNATEEKEERNMALEILADQSMATVWDVQGTTEAKPVVILIPKYMDTPEGRLWFVLSYQRQKQIFHTEMAEAIQRDPQLETAVRVVRDWCNERLDEVANNPQ
jgi:hypothetical protein